MPTVIISNNTTGVGTGDFSGTDDVRLRSNAATTNHDGLDLNITKWAAGDHQHSLIRFSGLSNIPSNATITEVTVGLRRIAGVIPGIYQVDIRRVLRAWVENQATWNVYTTGNNWTTAGALSAGDDRVSTVSGSINFSATTNQFYTVTQSSGGLVDDVQGWVAGTFSNEGWHFERQDAGEDTKDLVCEDSEGTDGLRPYLSVTYSDARRWLFGAHL